MKNKTYAFVDVQNTEGTASMLGFVINWRNLVDHLNKRYESAGNYFYLGIEYGDKNREKKFEDLRVTGATVRAKFYKKYKMADRVYRTVCPKCGKAITGKINGGLSWKCNCDVDMTVDILEAIKGTVSRVLLFTGDGDFTPLIEKVLAENKDNKVYIYSSPAIVGGGSRLSTRLRKLTSVHGKRVIFVDLNLLRKIIEERNE